jgi:hypothetical protein
LITFKAAVPLAQIVGRPTPPQPGESALPPPKVNSRSNAERVTAGALTPSSRRHPEGDGIAVVEILELALH